MEEIEHERVDRFAGRTVADADEGYALIEARRRHHPAVGDPAPDFALSQPDRSGSVRLSSFQGAKPVVLIFGSLT